MKIRKLNYILICLLAFTVTFGSIEIEAKKKAQTTQSSNGKNSSGKNKKNSKKETSSKKNKKGKDNAKSSQKGKSSKAKGKSSKGNDSGNSRSGRKGKSNKNGSSRTKSTSTKKKGNVVKSTYKPEPAEVPQNDSLTLSVNRNLLDKIPTHLNPTGLRVNSVKPDKNNRSVKVSLNENFTYMPISRAFIDSLTTMTKQSLPDSLSNYNVSLTVGGKSLTYYIHKVDKLPEQYRHNPNFVKATHPIVIAPKGMDNDLIAMWHSHGRYYKNGGWAWQRPILFETAEDVYTMSYVLPFIVPMLENAGAYVFLPRERDPNPHEVIVDNDTNDGGQIYSQPFYKELNGTNKWETGELEGFIYDLPDFRDTENPFENGSYRQVKTQKGGSPSIAGWYADIPEEGEYAVYISYKSLPNSTTDARYTVNYSGGSKEFKVNQTMGGGTWIYLGTFPFEAGYSDVEPVVTVTNITEGQAGTLVTADAVKIGGGMGNIARSPNRRDIYYDPSTPLNDLAYNDTEISGTDDQSDDDDSDDGDDDDDGDDEGDDDEDGDDDSVAQDNNSPNSSTTNTTNVKKGPAPRFSTSGMPRFVEGARYWMHWAGFPEYVYSPFHGGDDYKDDYTSRGHWVNYLAGGSRVLPNADGLKLPIDAAFALHSDAGKRDNDSFVGTLGIYFTQNGASYKDGTPRINSRMLTDMVMQQIVSDIRREYEPNWTRRSMWDKSYLEARVPEVPTTLIELMSHQNYADMTYGLDPAFRFTVGRAIYKGIARFLAERKDRKLVIQPLPVKDFAIRHLKGSTYRLSWEPTPDKLEPTAMPNRYIIMERSGETLGFHKLGETKSTHFDINVKDHDIHSFYIIASNDGGVSFPSETLALREGTSNKKPVLIINGFTRVSAAGHSATSSTAGFYSDDDFGVPYIRDISYTGHQTEFRRSGNTGAGSSDYITKVIAGNTFDYPAVHGNAFSSQGIGFVSASVGAVEAGTVKLSDYELVDLILGKQKKTTVGRGTSGVRFKSLSDKLQKELRQYVEKGGDLIVSGQYLVSDLTDSKSNESDRRFAAELLGAQSADSHTGKSGRIKDNSGKQLTYSSTLNDKIYIVEKPDVINSSTDVSVEPFLSFGDGGTAGQYVKYGKGNVAVMTIPFETITDAGARSSLLKQVLTRLSQR